MKRMGIMTNRPITTLGQLLWDGIDPRLQPVHDDTTVSQLSLMAIFLKHKNKYGCSSADMNELISLIRSVACPGSRIPKDIDEMEKLTRELVIPHRENLICKCEKFRFETEASCTFCGGRKDAATKYYTIPIGPRLQQLKEISTLSKLLIGPRPRPTRFVDDLHESPAWKTFKEEVGKDAIALSYCSDGFNPFHHNITAGTYSIWAQSGLILNLPAHLRTSKSLVMLFGLISGPRAPKRLNIYNEIIVDELVQLDRGIDSFDRTLGQSSLLRARIFFTICDVPGNAKEQNRVQQNAKSSCTHCHLKGIHNPILDKTTYAGGRIYLKPEHPFRFDPSFPTRSIEEDQAAYRTRDEELAVSKFFDRMEHDTRSNGTNHKAMLSSVTQDSGRYGSCQWMRLPYLDMQRQHSPVEPMHAVKVVAEHITKLLNGDEDGCKVRAQERYFNRFTSSCPNEVYRVYVKEKPSLGQKRKRNHVQPSNNQGDTETSELDETATERSIPKKSLPPAPFTLTNEEKKTADSRLKSLRFPENFDIPDTLFTNICGGIKTHTWHKLFTTGVLRYCLKGLLGDQQRRSLMHFFKGLETLFSTTDMEKIDDVTDSWHVALCAVERDFPLSLQSFVMHLLHHLPHYIKLYGPPKNFWMYPYERFNKTLSECITNNRNPELSAIRKMEMHWLVTMLECAGYLEPLNSRPDGCKVQLQFLRRGAFQPTPRQMTDIERNSIGKLFNRPLTSQNITIYHYASKTSGATEVQYRDITKDSTEGQVSSCVISCGLPQGQFIGIIQFFFHHTVEDVDHELAFVDWIGQPELCTDSFCHYVVRRNNTTTSPVMFVSQLSAPLIHVWDADNTLWLPSI